MDFKPWIICRSRHRRTCRPVAGHGEVRGGARPAATGAVHRDGGRLAAHVPGTPLPRDAGDARARGAHIQPLCDHNCVVTRCRSEIHPIPYPTTRPTPRMRTVWGSKSLILGGGKVEAVELDPVVIAAAYGVMGFPQTWYNPFTLYPVHNSRTQCHGPPTDLVQSLYPIPCA